MAKRHACWVIVAGTSPTAFHARRAEDLLPTLRQLQRTQPDTVLKWFDRGRLWASPSEADEALKAQRRAPTTRGRDWRPGGQHVDPRAKYQLSRDEKRARFKQRAIRERRGPVSPPADDSTRVPSGETRPPDQRPRKQGAAPWTHPPGHHQRKPGPSGWTRPPGDGSRKPGPPSWTRPPGNRPQGDRSRKPGPSSWGRTPDDRSRKQGSSGWTPPPGDNSRKPGPSGWTRPPGPGNRRPGNRFRPKQNTRGRKPK